MRLVSSLSPSTSFSRSSCAPVCSAPSITASARRGASSAPHSSAMAGLRSTRVKSISRRSTIVVHANRDKLRTAFKSTGPPPDLASRLMFERIIYLGMPIDDSVSELLVAQLLWLGRPISSLSTNKVEPIYMYVNSQGMAKNPDKPGNEHQAFAVYTMMLAVQKFCPIYTLCVGNAFGEAALLLSAGTPGKRAALRSSTIMIRQPLQRYSGLQASDIDIYRREIRYTTNLMADYLAWHTKKDIDTIKQDFARPRYFTPYEAVEYGLIDTVLEPHDNDRILYKDWDKIGSKIGKLQVDDDSDTVPSNILY